MYQQWKAIDYRDYPTLPNQATLMRQKYKFTSRSKRAEHDRAVSL